ncbi:MAG: twin-arginine translocase TatA/TatE family subunit [Phycisphaeraceae bacterium]|nr:twin-arginine translocase TatA/TatE family subunit [Phycisphaeraceae bacterium]
MTALAFINDLLSPWHLAIILIFGLLIFGKRLPEVGRGLGRSIVEFKKGLKGIDDDLEEQTSRPKARDPYVEGGYRAPIESAPPQHGAGAERPRATEPAAPRERMADDPQ